MMKFLIVFSVVCLLSNVHVRASVVEQMRNTPSKAVFTSVPQENREEFIKYHLAEGLGQKSDVYANMYLAQENEFANAREITTPDEFSTNFLNWFQEEFKASDTDVYNFVNYKQICFPSGTCVDPEDIGNLCCPF